MAKRVEAITKPELLTWGRYSCGMPKSIAARKIGVSVSKLVSWESGEARPTVKQLRKVANVYRQTFAAFFLQEPPERFEPPVHDFRKLSPEEDESLSPELLIDIRNSIDRREIYLELMHDFGEDPLSFKFKTSIQRDPEKVAARIRKILKVTSSKQSGWKDKRIAFNNWRKSIEDVGVLVFQAIQVPLSEMRGYSVAKFPLPVIVVNRKDSLAGRSFSMIHELAHIMLRESSLCDLIQHEKINSKSLRTEVFCNHVAGATLVPKERLLLNPIVEEHIGITWDELEISSLSKSFCVSREVVLRRLLVLGKTSRKFYMRKRKDYQKEFESIPKKSSGFLPPSTNIVSASGKPYARIVIDAFNSNLITSSDTSDYLGARLKHLAKISQEVGIE